jgi:hypothetical protein
MQGQPGGWFTAERGAKLATAALGAAAAEGWGGGRNDDKRRTRDRDNDYDDDSRGRDRGNGRSRRMSDVERFGDALGGFLADEFSNRRRGGDRR